MFLQTFHDCMSPRNFCQFSQIFYIDDNAICEQKQFFFLPSLHTFSLVFFFLVLFHQLELSEQCCKEIVRDDIFVLYLMQVREDLSFSPLSMMLLVGFWQMFLIKLRKFLKTPSLLEVFIKNGCWFCQMLFLYLYIDYMIFLLQGVDVIDHTDCFH